MRYLISISYDGSLFYGFERQPKKNTVQGKIEEALKKIFNEDITIKGAGRTDRGVHAYDQKAHFDVKKDLPNLNLKDALNSNLLPSIYINDVSIVDNNFHARFNVLEKTYEYYINLGEFNPIKDNYIYNYCKKLDINKMKTASKYLIGMHSYEAFTSGERENYDSIIYKVSITKRNNILKLTFVGKSFYRYMVRNMVGALLEVGKGNITTKEFKEYITKKSKVYNYITVPANGLYLKKIKY